MRDHCEMRPSGVTASGTAPKRLLVLVVRSIGMLAFFAMASIEASYAVPLNADQFNGLAQACAKGVPTEVLRAVAAKESHFEPLAIHNNTKKLTQIAVDPKSAAVLAERWISAGDSVDVGLMQINAPNLAPLGITVAQAFDPCSSLAAAAAVLRAAYSKGTSLAEQEAALLIMLSRYNTGRPLNGLVNGYVGDVIGGPAVALPTPAPAVPNTESSAPILPTWDIWANAKYAKSHGAEWLVDLSGPAVPSSSSTPTGISARKSP